MEYIYALVDTSKEVNIQTEYGVIKHLPFYIGKGTYTKFKTERYNVHYFDAINYRNINPHKERKIRKLLKTNSFSIQILYDHIDTTTSINDVEKELISFLGRKCNNKKGLLTNISEGGDGGYVWKDNPIAVKNIKEANKDRWKGENNPNSSKNRRIEDTPSYKRKLEGTHWNIGKYRTLYEVYTDNLISLGIFNSNDILINFNIKLSNLCSGIYQGKKIKNKFYIRDINKNLKIKISSYNKMLDDGIVRSTCIIHKNNEYVEIDRNSLSPFIKKE